MTIRNLDALFRPKSLAVIGASARPKSLGRVLIANATRNGFDGPVWPVNPRYTEIDGRRCYGRVADLPSAPDLAVIATPPETVPGLIAALGARGTRAAVVITAGLDRGPNSLTQTMLDAAQPHCLRILGPNCLGVMASVSGLDASFAHQPPLKGSAAFVSQSGAVIAAVLDWAAARNIGFSHMVSVGDMADVDFGDLFDYLAGDTSSSVILAYIEAVTHARKFMSAARSAARAKPVIVIKAGRSAAAAKAAASHTGALAGADAVYDAAFRRAGVLRVDDLDDMFAAIDTLARIRPPKGERLAIVTNGGGAGVLAVDALAAQGGVLATLAPETLALLDAVLPASWSRADPVDIIGDADGARYRAALDAVLADPNTDAVLALNCPTALTSSLEAAEATLEAAANQHGQSRRGKPLLTCWLGEATAQAARDRFEEAGLPSFTSPRDAIEGFTQATRYAKAQRELRRTPPSPPEGVSVDVARARAAMAAAKREGRAMLTGVEAEAVLAACGAPVVGTEVAATPEAAEAAAARLLAGGAEGCVVKILSPDISHKSDVGGVRLDLRGAAEVKAAAAEMLARVAALRPDATLQGVTVQPMIRRPRAHELIIGLSEDPTFGPVVLFGAGGTSVEAAADTALALPPLDHLLAEDLIAETRIARLLRGYRDRPAADLDAVALTLMRISQLAADLPEIRELDINPLLADENGVLALDARIVIDPEADGEGPNPRFSIRPYPGHLTRSAALPDGAAVTLRPVRPEDEPLYREFLGRIAPEDLKLRFFAPLKAFSHGFVARLTQIDYARAMVFLALDETGAMLGAARLHAEPNHQEAEFAVLVRSDLQGRGLGWLLMTTLIDYAREDGLKTLHGDVLSRNTTMLRMSRKLGFDLAPSREPSVTQVTLTL